jgi:hypothetical protein
VRIDLATGGVGEDPAAPDVRTYPDSVSRDEAAADLRGEATGP